MNKSSANLGEHFTPTSAILLLFSSFNLFSFSLTAVSAELNEPETTQLPQQQHYQTDQMPVSDCQFAGSKVLNVQFGQTEERAGSASAGEEHHPDRGQILVAVSELAQEGASYCSISSDHRLPPTHFGQLMGEHVAAVKRFLNRFVFITSHYRSYELTPSQETATCLATTKALSPVEGSQKLMSESTHQPTDSSTSEVIHLNSEQVQPKL